MLASACGLWLTAAAMAEVPVTQAGPAAWSMLTATHLGTAWTIGMAALAASSAAMAFVALRPARLAAFSLSEWRSSCTRAAWSAMHRRMAT